MCASKFFMSGSSRRTIKHVCDRSVSVCQQWHLLTSRPVAHNVVRRLTHASAWLAPTRFFSGISALWTLSSVIALLWACRSGFRPRTEVSALVLIPEQTKYRLVRSVWRCEWQSPNSREIKDIRVDRSFLGVARRDWLPCSDPETCARLGIRPLCGKVAKRWSRILAAFLRLNREFSFWLLQLMHWCTSYLLFISVLSECMINGRRWSISDCKLYSFLTILLSVAYIMSESIWLCLAGLVRDRRRVPTLTSTHASGSCAWPCSDLVTRERLTCPEAWFSSYWALS